MAETLEQELRWKLFVYLALSDGGEEPGSLLEVEVSEAPGIAPGIGPGWEVGMEESVKGRGVDGRDDGEGGRELGDGREERLGP